MPEHLKVLRSIVIRRVFVLSFAAAFARADEPCGVADVNKFKCLYNAWVALVWRRGDKQVLDAQEVAAWREVRRAWKELEKTVDRGYGI